MSGLPPRQPSGNQSRELVFCHQCRNEWYRDQHGLVCPECESDFTEILEHDESAPHRTLVDSDDDYDEEDDGFYSHHRHHHADHDHRDTGFGPAPHGTGFTLRMGGGSGPQISFRTIQPQFGSSSGSPGPQHPFGGGHVIGGVSPNPRQPSFPSSPFDHFHAHFPGAGARSMRSTPQSDPLNQQRDDRHQQQQQQQQEQQQQQQQQRSSPAATSNFGNASQPVMDIFASIVQNIMGVPREGDPNDNTRNQQYHVPGAFPGGRSPPMAGQNNPGQGSSQAEGLGGPGHSPGTVPSPGGWSHGGPPGGPHGGSPHGMESPLFMQMPRGRGGVTYYSSTRTWTGPNGEVRTIRTSSPMPPHGQQGPEGPGEMNLASILVNIIGSGAHGDDGNGFPPLLRAFGLGHGQTGDYAWNQQDMDRILSQLMEQHQGNAPPPASEESIRNLSKVKVTQAEVDDGSECVVCQDEYKVDDEVVKLPCKHIYHEECVTRWLETHDACPICRTPITPEDQRRQRPTPGAPPGASGSGFPPLPGQGGSGGTGGSGGAAGGSSNMHTSSGSGGSNGARWTWSTSFGRG